MLAVIILGPKGAVKKQLYRSEEKKYSAGAIYYFLSLIFLFLVFPLPIFAGAWAIMALGDGIATIAGNEFGKNKIWWNHKKSLVGSLAFFIFSAIGLAVVFWWFGVTDFGFYKVLFVALIMSLLESLPIRINDNVSIPLASAVLLSILI